MNLRFCPKKKKTFIVAFGLSYRKMNMAGVLLSSQMSGSMKNMHTDPSASQICLLLVSEQQVVTCRASAWSSVINRAAQDILLLVCWPRVMEGSQKGGGVFLQSDRNIWNDDHFQWRTHKAISSDSALPRSTDALKHLPQCSKMLPAQPQTAAS